MIVNTAEFTISAVGPTQYPDGGLPEIAFVGRSNVGKSSLINCLINRRGLARTSSTPGRTQTMNYYNINNAFYFVDLPGYGYARAPFSEKQKWARFSEDYILHREPLRLTIHLVDSRHPPMDKDIVMAEWLAHAGRPALIVATKADKKSRSELNKQVSLLQRKLGLFAPLVVASAETGAGKEELWKLIAERLD